MVLSRKLTRAPRESGPPTSASTSASTASYCSGSSQTQKNKQSETEQAELLSQAANQAMIAARSILNSGGTRKTALSTAQAAAQSILEPDSRGDESMAGAFWGRRKAKRQAKVVASVALISVKNAERSLGAPNVDGEPVLTRQPSFSTRPPSLVGPPSHASSRSTIGDQSISSGIEKRCPLSPPMWDAVMSSERRWTFSPARRDTTTNTKGHTHYMSHRSSTPNRVRANSQMRLPPRPPRSSPTR